MDSPAPPQTPIALLDEFLVVEEWQGLLYYTLSRAPAFHQSQVLNTAGNSMLDHAYRRSRVLFDLGEFHGLFVQRLMTFLPHILFRIGLPEFPVSQVEVQMTASSNGEFFRAHTDNDSEGVGERHVTFVYFFHTEPRAFSGGELRIFDTAHYDGRAVATGAYRLVQPMQNQLICFPSSCLHEILPVVCPGGAFEHSRFTVNGWFHR
jgi:Rps23 Pro-64 3,4-dihydroxylase Tpa1-like proline 4-hydroxylase